MSIRAHRIEKIIYAEKTLFNSGHGNLSDFLLNHDETNDQRNNDGGGLVEFPFRVLKEALEDRVSLKFNDEEIESLIDEIYDLEKKGKGDYDYIQYDLF